MDNMENTVIAAIDEARAEAIERMKFIGLKQEYIDAFEKTDGYEIFNFWSRWIKDVEPEPIDEDEETAIAEFESVNSAIVWAVVHELVTEDGEDWDGYHLLFVSKDKSKWEKERKELMEMKPTVYFKCISSETNTINRCFCDYKIAVNDGVIVGME